MQGAPCLLWWWRGHCCRDSQIACWVLESVDTPGGPAVCLWGIQPRSGGFQGESAPSPPCLLSQPPREAAASPGPHLAVFFPVTILKLEPFFPENENKTQTMSPRDRGPPLPAVSSAQRPQHNCARKTVPSPGRGWASCPEGGWLPMLSVGSLSPQSTCVLFSMKNDVFCYFLCTNVYCECFLCFA